MTDSWNKAREAYRHTPIPEELAFAVASAVRAGSRRHRRRQAARRGLTGLLAGCACFVLLVNASPTFARAVSAVPVLGELARVVTVTEYTLDSREQLIDVRMPALELPENTDLEQRINTEIRTRIDQVLQQAEERARGRSGTPMWRPGARRRTSSPWSSTWTTRSSARTASTSPSS